MDIFTSSIHPHFFRSISRKSSASFFPILIFFLFVGIFGYRFFFNTWGIVSCLLSISMAIWGMILFLKLKRLKKHPHKICLLKTKWEVTLFKKKKMTLLPINITSIEYVQKKNVYGINLQTETQIVFLPFFSRSTYARMHDIMHANQTN